MAVTGSNTEQPQFIASTGNRSFSSNAPLIENSDAHQIVVPDVSIYIYIYLKENEFQWFSHCLPSYHKWAEMH